MIKKEFEHFFVIIQLIEYKKLAITTDSELNNNMVLQRIKAMACLPY